MFDEPPAPPPLEPAVAPVELAAPELAAPKLPSERRPDGSLLIDLTPLAPPQQQQCIQEEPDPINPEIVVCRKTEPSPRLGANYGPPANDIIAGSAVPRARFKLSEDAEAEANVINKGVGGWNANGGEVRVKIDF